MNPHEKASLPETQPTEIAPDNSLLEPPPPVQVQLSAMVTSDIGTSNTLQTPEALSGKYELLREIGKGTQGHIYLAKRLSDATSVAIKELRIDSIQNWKAYDLFHRESDVLSSLNIHGVAKFYEAIESLENPHPRAYIIQEFIDGKSLEQMIKNGYRFTPAQFFSFGESLLGILEQLHHHNPPIVHRDIKPSNIMLVPSENQLNTFELYLIDFGAVANPQVQGGGSTVAGTYGYMPPEQLTGHPSPASDIYSLAAMMASLLSGVTPDEMKISDFHLVIDSYLENIPRSVVCVLQMMLDPDPSKRLADHKLLKEVFHHFSHENYDLAVLPEKIRKKLARIKSISSHEFNKRLMAVKQLNQMGNTELWMQLPETTPRKVPKCYLKYRFKQTEKTFHYERSSDDYSFKTKFILTICVIGIPIISLAAPDFIIPDHTPKEMIIYTLILLIIPALIVAIIWHFYDSKPSSGLSITETNIKNRFDNVAKILKYGRKTIATVVSVDYVPPQSISIRKLRMSSKQENCIHTFPDFICVEQPYFKIRYKFNPPDDSESTDLIHEFYVFNDVRMDILPGSPLPILYSYSGTPDVVSENNTFVQSMPFPIPFSYLFMSKTKLVCNTLCGKIFQY